jgi:hypothetical protein
LTQNSHTLPYPYKIHAAAETAGVESMGKDVSVRVQTYRIQTPPEDVLQGQFGVPRFETGHMDVDTSRADRERIRRKKNPGF